MLFVLVSALHHDMKPKFFVAVLSSRILNSVFDGVYFVHHMSTNQKQKFVCYKNVNLKNRRFGIGCWHIMNKKKNISFNFKPTLVIKDHKRFSVISSNKRSKQKEGLFIFYLISGEWAWKVWQVVCKFLRSALYGWGPKVLAVAANVVY